MTDTTITDHAGSPPVRSSRRGLLLGLGAAALTGTAIAVGSVPDAAQAATTAAPTAQSGVTVAELRKRRAKADDVVIVVGHRTAGDMPAVIYRGLSSLEGRAADGGLVVSGAKGTAWVLQHDGVVDFRVFGVLGPKQNADDALDALIADPTVSRIEAHTDLNFVRRHRFTRSDVELDFRGHLVTTEGIEKAGKDDPFAAVMFFQGEVTDVTQEVTVADDIAELSDLYPVSDSSAFRVGDWVTLEVNALTGRWEREVQRLVRVTQIVDGSTIRVGYKTGWALASGRTLTWRIVRPVQRVVVRNMRFFADGADEFTGSHPLAFEYATECDVHRVDAVGTFWPVIMRRWNTHYITEGCSLTNPTSVTWGGAGYLTQQIYCLYGHVVDCRTSNARHLNDFTASAYSLVENCHGDGDDEGPFVTHGQYEHDLTYIGNSGLMTFANSGAAWGSVAKRITVKKHVCTWFVARVKVIDLTLEDVQVIKKASLAGSGMMWINADGAQLRGCSADDTFLITQSSSQSKRPTVIADSRFHFSAANDVTAANVTVPVTIRNTILDGVNGQKFLGTGSLRIEGGSINGQDGASAVTIAATHAVVSGTHVNGVGIVAATGTEQRIDIDAGARFTPGGEGARIARSGSGVLRLAVGQVSSEAADGAAHIALGDGVNHVRVTGASLRGGTLDLAPAAFAGASTLAMTGTVEESVKRVAMPEASDRVVFAGTVVA